MHVHMCVCVRVSMLQALYVRLCCMSLPLGALVIQLKQAQNEEETKNSPAARSHTPNKL